MTKLEAIAKAFDDELKLKTVGQFMKTVRDNDLFDKLVDSFHLMEVGNQLAIASVVGGKPVIPEDIERPYNEYQDIINEMRGE